MGNPTGKRLGLAPQRPPGAALLLLACLMPLACQRPPRSRPATAAVSEPRLPDGGGPATAPLIRNGDGDPTLRRPDGRIVRVRTMDEVIIDRGIADQLTLGTPFEVFDQHTGIPATSGVTNGDLPDGKATIEVVRMLPGYSECRVIRRTGGAAVSIGDLIVKRE